MQLPYCLRSSPIRQTPQRAQPGPAIHPRQPAPHMLRPHAPRQCYPLGVAREEVNPCRPRSSMPWATGQPPHHRQSPAQPEDSVRNALASEAVARIAIEPVPLSQVETAWSRVEKGRRIDFTPQAAKVYLLILTALYRDREHFWGVPVSKIIERAGHSATGQCSVSRALDCSIGLPAAISTSGDE